MFQSTLSFLLFIFFATSSYGQPDYIFKGDVKYQNPLIYYAYKGDSIKMKQLIKEDLAQVTRSVTYYPSQTFTQGLMTVLTLGILRNTDTITPIEAAVEGGKKNAVRLLLLNGASKPAAIQVMVREEKTELINWMIRRDSSCMYDVAKNAIRYSKLKYVKLLVETYKLDPNSGRGKNYEPLLFQVAKASSYFDPKDINYPIMNYVMSLPGLNVNLLDPDSNNAFMLSYKKFGRTKTGFIKLLLEKGIDLNIMNKQGYTLLDMSRIDGAAGSPELVQLGATRTSGNDGYIAFQRGERLVKAVKSFRDDGTIKKMSSEAIPVKFKDPKKLYEVVRSSIQSKNMDALYLIRDLPVNWNDSVMNCDCSYYNTNWALGYRKLMSYMQCSIKCNDTTLIKFLTERGANLNVRDESGNTALNAVVKRKSYIGAKLILERGFDANIPNTQKEPPLYFACKENDIKMAELLLKHGADINILIGELGLTLKDLSGKYKYSKEMKRLIKTNGGKSAKKLKRKKS